MESSHPRPSEPSWNELGVFKFFTFTLEEIEKFTISATLSRLEKQKEKQRLHSENVAGKCKNCKLQSSVHYGNPSNWVRHLKVSSSSGLIFMLYLLTVLLCC